MISLLKLLLLLLMVEHDSAQPTIRVFPRHVGSINGIRRGNGVVKSQDKLWITQGDGSLRILSVTEDDIFEIALFKPTQMTNRNTECKSSVALHEVDGVVQYGMYSVIDIPNGDTDRKIVSRVLAVSPFGEQLRETIVSGIAQGTPQISGEETYIIHNDFSTETHGGYNFGRLSVIDNRFGLARAVDLNGASVFGVEGVEREAPFGPISATSRIDPDADIMMYFGESWGNGEAAFGLVYEFNGEQVTGLTRTRWSTVTPPALSADGKSMWLAGSGSSVHGWVKNREFSSQPSWSTILGSGPRPILSKPLVASNSDTIFVITPHHQVFCLNATTGETVWGNSGQDTAPEILQLSGDGSTLFTIGTDEGVVTQYNARTGRIQSQISCHDLHNEEICTMPVEGMLSISHEGEKVYFGDIYGDIVVLDVGQATYPLEPTSSPSLLPSRNLEASVLPSSTPSSLPSIVPSLFPTFQSSALPSMVASLEPSLMNSMEPSLMDSMEPSLMDSIEPSLMDSMEPSIDLFSDAPVVSPSNTIFVTPVGSPAMVQGLSPAMMPILPPTQPLEPFSPVTAPVATAVPTHVETVEPSVETSMEPSIQPSVASSVEPSASSLDSAASLEPSRRRIDLNRFETNLESLTGSQKSAEESSSTSAGSYFVVITVVLLVISAVWSVGVLLGRVWQHRRDRWYGLPRTDEDVWFGQADEDKSYDTRLEQMD